MMDGARRAILLVGSPKGGASTSESLGRFLLEGMGRKGVATRSARVLPLLRSEEGTKGLLREIEDADLVVLSAPLYADSLPSGVTRALERIAADRKGRSGSGKKRFAALINCGFPEARHCDTALAICRVFAGEAGMEWAGGLALGGGEAIAGRPLGEAGGAARNARKALAMAADALADGRPVPGEAVSRMARQAVPGRLYVLMGNLGWLLEAGRRGTLLRLKDRPYPFSKHVD